MGSTGVRGCPWPELLPDRCPVLVVPAGPGRVVVLEDGWADRDTPAVLTATVQPDWSVVLDGSRLTVCQPGGVVWFDGGILVSREWRRRARDHRTVLLITGPFTSVVDFQSVAAAGRLFLLTVPIRLADHP